MFKLNVLTPERKAVFDQEITKVTVPAHSGEMTILPGHSPLITTLGTGILKYKIKGQEKTYKAVISWGYCEVSPETVNVLAEFMQTPEEVVEETAKNHLQNAEKKLITEVLNDADYVATMNEADKARAAINLVKH
ncbi:ATP synthase F1 subunit epsilon [bacterium]|nr:ATP synthase F1 subunit epsilon [bacterium]